MATKYKKSFAIQYLKNLKKDFRKSKIYQNMEDDTKKIVDDFHNSINQDNSDKILNDLNLTSKPKPKRSSKICSFLMNNDNLEAQMLIFDELNKKKKCKTEYKEELLFDKIGLVVSQLNLSSLNDDDKKSKNAKILNSLDYLLKVKSFGSKEEKEIIKIIESNLNKNALDGLLDKEAELNFDLLNDISFVLSKNTNYFMKKEFSNDNIFNKNKFYFDQVKSSDWNNYQKNLINFGETIGLFQTKETENEYILARIL